MFGVGGGQSGVLLTLLLETRVSFHRELWDSVEHTAQRWHPSDLVRGVLVVCIPGHFLSTPCRDKRPPVSAQGVSGQKMSVPADK